MNKYIPLSVPSINGNEWKYVKECLDTNWVSSAGVYVDRFEKEISRFTKAKYAVACSSGTSALQVSLRLAGVESGDEVIVPSLTFVAPINAIVYNNAQPIFMDSDKYFNIDVDKTIEFIKKETDFVNGYSYNLKTKKRISAIIPVHIWGNAVRVNDLVELCNKKNITIIEDASESLGTFYSKGNFAHRHTGTIGKMGCISFNGNKIITTGGGGAIVTNDKKIAEKAKYLTTQAKDDPIYFIHNEVGYNFRLTNIQAAIGVAQLEQLPIHLKKKKYIYNSYISQIEESSGFEICDVPKYATNNHWISMLRINKDLNKLNIPGLINYLEKNKIQSRPIWRLNHLQKPYNDCFSYKIENAPKLVAKCLCIPSSPSLTDSELEYISKKLNSYE